jgi:Nuclear protein 96
VVQIAADKSAGSRARQLIALQLLSAHDLDAAASAAAASGHPRLATLAATAGLDATSTALLRRQLVASDGRTRAAWQSAGMFDGDVPLISDTLEATYKLLAGDVRAALPLLAAPRLTWQRAFGLTLWYATPPGAPVAGALQHYDDLLVTSSAASSSSSSGGGSASDGAPPPPVPHHLPAQRWPAAVDAQYALVRLCAANSDAAASSAVRGAAWAEAAEQLACTRSYSRDALDAIMPWMTLSLLRAVGALPAGGRCHAANAATDTGDADMADGSQQPGNVSSGRTSTDAGAQSDAVFTAATLACADSLVLLEEPAWAVYVLLHLPAASSGARAAKADAIRSTLARQWPLIEQQGIADTVSFLCEKYEVPRAWLAAAEAGTARRDRDAQRLTVALLAAGEQAEAERVLFEEAAPALAAPTGIARLAELTTLFGDALRTNRVATLQVRAKALQIMTSGACASSADCGV